MAVIDLREASKTTLYSEAFIGKNDVKPRISRC